MKEISKRYRVAHVDEEEVVLYDSETKNVLVFDVKRKREIVIFQKRNRKQKLTENQKLLVNILRDPGTKELFPDDGFTPEPGFEKEQL